MTHGIADWRIDMNRDIQGLQVFAQYPVLTDGIIQGRLPAGQKARAGQLQQGIALQHHDTRAHPPDFLVRRSFTFNWVQRYALRLLGVKHSSGRK